MKVYIDASVLMRIVLGQRDPLAEWDDIRDGISSALLAVEGHRTFDLFWHRGELNENELAQKRSVFNIFLPRLDIRPLDERVLEIASQPLPTRLATLDAIHLATAMIYRAAQPPNEPPLLFATHDRELATAARAMNFEVLGAPA